MFFDPTFVEGHKKNRKGTVELALRGQLDAGIQTSGICPVDVRQSKFASYDWQCIGSLEEGTPFAVRKWGQASSGTFCHHSVRILPVPEKSSSFNIAKR